MSRSRRAFISYKLEPGDILLNEGQSTELVGRPAMWRGEKANCCFQNTLVRFKADRKICEPTYALWLFLYYLRHGEFAKISSKTSSIAHLGAQRFAQMKFPLPPLAQQQYFASLVTRHQRLRAIQQESLRQAEHLFQTLLKRAFGASVGGRNACLRRLPSSDGPGIWEEACRRYRGAR